MYKFCLQCYLLLMLLCINTVSAQTLKPVTVSNAAEIVTIDSGIGFLEDANHNFSPENVFKSGDFKINTGGTPNMNVTSSAFWFKLKIRNETNLPQLILKLSYPEMDSIDYYEQMGPDSFRNYRTGESQCFAHREYLSTDYLFTVYLPPHTEKYIYLRVSTNEALLLPLEAGTEKAIFKTDKSKDIFWGMYIGLMLGMLLYNCFVYITTRDRSYLFYIVYVLAVVITQITISGYSFQLLWPNGLLLAKYSAFFNPAFSGITALGFIRHFLKTKVFLPRVDKIILVFIVLYAVGALFGFAGKYTVSLNMIDMTAGILSLSMLAIAIIISSKGYRPAIFFLISWVVFLTGVFIFVFKNFGILPYNNFTIYTMPVGSAMEVILLSFALADRINILKRESQQAQANELLALQENKRIVLEQNVMLEEMVDKRTLELKLSNEWLNKTLVELKDAQQQLVESEKMASLGQLTAGIAHEINNPITFVSSNIMPLNRDVRMLIETISEMEKIMKEGTSVAEKERKVEAYKNEIDFDYLKFEIEQSLFGIKEGASRTADIVKGLRIFSHLDEADLKKADINAGLDSTLGITNNLLNNLIRLEKKYAALPLVECYSAKLNQVFLNIIANAIFAIKVKFSEKEGGLLTITTYSEQDDVFIKIADNGCGMTEDTKKRIFEPFFTTKDVGGGIGLGLSIAFNTVNKHKGQILVNSKVGIGTEFVIKLPLVQD